MYWVTLDDGTPQAYSALNAVWTKPQTLLYMARGLSDGNHTMKVTNLGYPAQTALNLDYATVYGAQPKCAPCAIDADVSLMQRAEASPCTLSTRRMMTEAQTQTLAVPGALRAMFSVVHRLTPSSPDAGTIVAAVLIPIFIIIWGLLLLLLQRRRRGWPFNTPRLDETLTPYPNATAPMQQQHHFPPLHIPGHAVQPHAGPHPFAAPSVMGGYAHSAPSCHPATTAPSAYPTTEAGAPRAGGAYPFAGISSRSGGEHSQSNEGLPEYREAPTTPQRELWAAKRSV